jgi:hypothetical protein
MLQIAVDKVREIIVKARAFDAKVAAGERDYGDNPSDDDMREVLEDYADDPVLDELTQFIDGLNVDEQAELVALVWLGRGDYEIEDWNEAVAEAAAARTDAEATSSAEYLLGTPMLGDLLEEGLDRHGEVYEETERGERY